MQICPAILSRSWELHGRHWRLTELGAGSLRRLIRDHGTYWKRASLKEGFVILLAINILIIIVIGAIFFWVVDRFVRDGRLANLLKILIVLVCLGGILARVLPMLSAGSVM